MYFGYFFTVEKLYYEIIREYLSLKTSFLDITFGYLMNRVDRGHFNYGISLLLYSGYILFGSKSLLQKYV